MTMLMCKLLYFSIFQTLLVQTWYPTTVATTSYFQKILIADYLKETADDFSGLPFMLHDFGFRAATCVEVSAIEFFFLSQNR